MNFELTKHAAEVIKERNIPDEYIERVICNPQLREPDANDTELQHYMAEIVEHENRVLRVIVNDHLDPMRVITAFFDRNMRGKL